MHKLHYVLLLVFLSCLFFCENVSAVGGNVVISQIQLGDSGSAKHEFVEIYNNTESDIEVTDWCIYYQTSTLTQYKMSCLLPENDNQHLFLPSYSSIFIVSNELITSNPLLGYDLNFSATLSGVAGYVRLLDGSDMEVDRVGWGISSPENDLAAAAPSGKVISRKTLEENVLIDTDIYSEDFVVSDPKEIYQYGAVFEMIDICPNITGIQDLIPDGYELNDSNECVPPPVDLCLNIDGFQATLPMGYGIDTDGDCKIDVCLNISGIQSIIPDNYEYDQDGDCVPHDECLNIEDAQNLIPDGMFHSSSGVCSLFAKKLVLSEILPNASGTDEGNEYIEIYNPNEMDILLTDYMLLIGINFDKSYSFPTGSILKAKSYIAFSNDDIKFTLLNTTSSVRLVAVSEEIIDESMIYINPKDDESWVRINDIWQYTNRLTLGYENLVAIVDQEEVLGAVTELSTCAVGYYRSQETNRCRKIIDTSTELAPCKDGQYRSEETNRCRNIVSDVAVLLTCAEGEERSPSTNRCRKIAVAIEPEPCAANQERNPETNRCRNIVAKSIPVAEYKPEVIAESNNNVVNWSITTVLVFAVFYGIWEWRWEISRLFKKNK